MVAPPRCCACGVKKGSIRARVEESGSGQWFCSACRRRVTAAEEQHGSDKLFLCSIIAPEVVVWAAPTVQDVFLPWRLPPLSSWAAQQMCVSLNSRFPGRTSC
jgi:hypothetical protein